MLLSIDEVINTTPDSTVVVFGQNANVFDIPALATAKGNLAAFKSCLGMHGVWLIAPSTTSDVEPASVTAANLLFGTVAEPGGSGGFPVMYAAQSMALWPVESGIPAYKQGLVTTAFYRGFQGQLAPIWVFVVSPSGGVTVQLIQMITYQAIGDSGDLKVGESSYLVGINQEWFWEYGLQEPPNFNYALTTATWKVQPGNLDWHDVQGFTMPGVPFIDPKVLPVGWGQAVTVTTLLENSSRPFDVEWGDDGENNWVEGVTPSSPILHHSILVGGSLSFKRPWVQDYAANLIDYSESAANALQVIEACVLCVLKVAIDASGDLDWPIGGVVDYLFDEAMQYVDPGFNPPIPSWLQ